MSVNFRDAISSSIRYWEPRRLIFNGVLLVVVVASFFAAWPTSKMAVNLELALSLFILATLANVAYCAAYVPDLALQFSTFRESWLRWRWVLLTLGTLFGAALAYFFTRGLFGPVYD